MKEQWIDFNIDTSSVTIVSVWSWNEVWQLICAFRLSETIKRDLISRHLFRKLAAEAVIDIALNS